MVYLHSRTGELSQNVLFEVGFLKQQNVFVKHRVCGEVVLVHKIVDNDVI